MTSLASLRARDGALAPRPSLQRTVAHSDDLVRIRDAPRRVWQDDPGVAELQDVLTAAYRHTPGKTRHCGDVCEGCRATRLKPAQAVALVELHDLGEGAFWPLRPGAGKTLITLLAATVLEAKRALLIVPASGEVKTQRAIQQYARHWRIAPITVVSYEWLSNPKQVDWLASFAPDLVVCDEAHKLKSSGCKVWKRLARYGKAHPEVRCVFATGTAAGRSIKEYWHYLRAALRSRAPVPSDPMEAVEWAAALDEKVPPLSRFKPGPLVTLAPADGPDDITRARRAYMARLTGTPGVISTLEDVPPCDLRVRVHELELPPEVQAMLAAVRDTWTTPGGHQFMLPLDMWRHQRTLGCGLYDIWDPLPPQTWRDARREWFSWANARLSRSRTLDSCVHLIEAIQAGELDDEGRYAAWLAEKRAFGEPNSVATWCHTVVLEYAKRWVRDGGLIWVAQREFGERLARETGLPYFADGGLDARGNLVGEYRGPAAIASIAAIREQHNLQHFARNLVTCPPSTGHAWDQLLARTHRDGQDADEVECEVLLTSRESYQCLAQAYRDGIFSQETGGQPHRLVYATKEGWDTVLEMASGNLDLWNTIGV